jgi:type VI protein secretion system component VasF
MTFAAAVEQIAVASGREVGFRTVSLQDFTQGLAAAGVPGDVVDLTRYLFAEVLDGRNAQLGDGVQQALGRAPRDFSDYARAAAARGAWGSALVSQEA